MPEASPKTASYSTAQPPRPAGPPSLPGHRRRRRLSDYGRQLAEKQKAKREYGLRERQFRNDFLRAIRSPITTGQALITILERRLDSTLYRAGMAKSRAMARQWINHGHVLVSGRKVTKPGYQVEVGDRLTLKNPAIMEYNKDVVIPGWLSYAPKGQTAKVEGVPKADDLPSDVDVELIIEFYSR